MVDNPSKAPPESRPFQMPSPFAVPVSLQPEKRPSVAQRAKVPTFWAVVGVVLGAAVQYLMSSHGVPPQVVDAAARAVQQQLQGQQQPQLQGR